MQLLDGELVLSASDLTGFAACGHLTQLELGAAHGEYERAKRDDPMLDVLSRRGGEHELKHLARYQADGLTVAVIDAIPFDAEDHVTRANLAAAEAETLAAMRRGDDVIYQATFFDGRWRGHADFLLKVDTPSPELGAWSYEVADTKLARRVKAGALLQMCHYSEHVARLQGVEPVHMHVITGDGEQHTEKVRDYAAYYRHLKRRFETVVGEAERPTTYPDPVEHCGVCRWGDVCKDRRRADDHLSLVAGMRSDQTRKLVASGIVTRTALGTTEPDTSIAGMNQATFDKLRAQASLQVRGEGMIPQLYELLEPERPEVAHDRRRRRGRARSRRPARRDRRRARRRRTVAQARVRRAARAVARRPLLRHGGRPVRARRRPPRVPVRRRSRSAPTASRSTGRSGATTAPRRSRRSRRSSTS